MCARQLHCDKIGIAQQDAPPPGGVPFGELAGEFAIGRIADGSELAGQLSSESGSEVEGQRAWQPKAGAPRSPCRWQMLRDRVPAQG